MSGRSSVSKMPVEFSLNSISHQSTRAYFKGRAYIKIILKNHARSYYRGKHRILVCQNVSSTTQILDWNPSLSEASRLSTLPMLWRKPESPSPAKTLRRTQNLLCYFIVASEKLTTYTMREKHLLAFSIWLFRFLTNCKSTTNTANR